MKIYRQSEPDFERDMALLREKLRAGIVAADDGETDVVGIVRDIIARVADDGDRALVELEKRLDGVDLTPDTVRVAPDRIAAARAAADDAFLALIRRAARNVREYQEYLLPPRPVPLRRGGRELSVRHTPIERVGVYVPGGRALYPSSVLMAVVPAQVAGVGDIAVASPPSADGDIDPMVLALAGELGITEVYRLGGAVAVAAMAMGTERVKPVRKIVGPGNAFVAEAKRQLFGIVGIDSIAGPSEVLIVADDTGPPEWIAADMIAQAEHDPGSALLVTTSPGLAEDVISAIDRQVAALERREAIREALDRHSAVVLVEDMDAACRIASDFAPEHLQVMTTDDDAVFAGIGNAGAAFLGPCTPAAVGDYYAGPSHVLPTGGRATFSGPLSVMDFLKSTSVVRYDAAAIAEDGGDIADFAAREGLTAHARAAEIRREDD